MTERVRQRVKQIMVRGCFLKEDLVFFNITKAGLFAFDEDPRFLKVTAPRGHLEPEVLREFGDAGFELTGSDRTESVRFPHAKVSNEN